MFLIGLSNPNWVWGKLKLIPVAKDLGVIWSMDDLDASKIIFTERSGKINILDINTHSITNISGVPKVFSKGQGGLLDVKVHPNFKKNKRVYLTYSVKIGDFKTTALGYGLLKANHLDAFKQIFVAKGKSKKQIHFGSRIAFENDSTLFFTVGDRGHRPNAQDLTNHFGKVLRIHDDGSTPNDNPFVKHSVEQSVKQSVKQKNALPQIWSYGHRNPQGLYYDIATKTLYEMEHGPRGGDEINIIQKGKNYGWPKQSYGKEYTWFSDVGEKIVTGTQQPIKYYVPSIAPSDLVMYRQDQLPEIKGKLLSGALALTHLNSYDPQTKQEIRYFEHQKERIRSLLIHQSNQLFIGTDSGNIYRVTN